MPPEPSLPGAPSASATAAIDPVIPAAQGMYLTIQLQNCYVRRMQWYAKAAAGDRDERHVANMTKRLLTAEAATVLLTVNILSPHASPAARESIGLTTKVAKTENSVTIHGLAETLKKELRSRDSIDAARNKAGRIVDAARFFKLIEGTEEGRENYKPIRGTRALFDLMVAIGAEQAIIARQALEPSTPEEGKAID